jgi:hypothetical protein
MPSEIVTRIEPCAYCRRDTIVVTVEHLLTERGEVVASIVLSRALCTRDECIGSRVKPR